MHIAYEDWFSRIDMSDLDGCWAWPGPKFADGYGQGWGRGAHRAIYERLVGAVPSGMELDHVCHTRDPACPGGDTCEHRACVNPRHLEVVSWHENQARSANTWTGKALRVNRCGRDLHEFTNENTYLWRGKRACRECRRSAQRKRRQAVHT